MLNRISAGWVLVKASGRIVRADSSLLAFPALSLACSLVALLVFANEVLFFGVVYGSWVAAVPFVVVGVYAVVFFSVFFNVALAAAANRSLEGEDTTLAVGLDVAWCRLGAIARWALVSLMVGFALGLLESSKGVLRWLGKAAEAAWSAVTFFVIPVIALEDADAGEARERSQAIVKGCWAEEIAGRAALRLIAAVPGIVIVLGGKVLFADGVRFTPTTELFLVVAGVLWLGTSLGVSALTQVFAVSLYRENAGTDTGATAQAGLPYPTAPSFQA